MVAGEVLHQVIGNGGITYQIRMDHIHDAPFCCVLIATNPEMTQDEFEFTARRRGNWRRIGGPAVTLSINTRYPPGPVPPAVPFAPGKIRQADSKYMLNLQIRQSSELRQSKTLEHRSVLCRVQAS